MSCHFIMHWQLHYWNGHRFLLQNLAENSVAGAQGTQYSRLQREAQAEKAQMAVPEPEGQIHAPQEANAMEQAAQAQSSTQAIAPDERERAALLSALQRLKTADDMQPTLNAMFGMLQELPGYNPTEDNFPWEPFDWNPVAQCQYAHSNQIKELLARYWQTAKTYNTQDLKRAQERDKNLAFACLKGADLRRVDLNNADLFGADLSDAILDSTTRLDNAKLLFTNLQGAQIIDCTINSPRIFHANLRAAHLLRTKINQALVIDAIFDGAVLEHVDFTNSKIIAMHGINTQYTHVSFANNIMHSLVCEHARMEDVTFFNNVLHAPSFNRGTESAGLVFNKNFVYNSDFSYSQFLHTDIQQTFLIKANFTHSTLQELRVINPPVITLEHHWRMTSNHPETFRRIEWHRKIYSLGLETDFAHATLIKSHFIGGAQGSFFSLKFFSEFPGVELYDNVLEGRLTGWHIQQPRGQRNWENIQMLPFRAIWWGDEKIKSYFYNSPLEADMNVFRKRLPVSSLHCSFKLALLKTCYFRSAWVTPIRETADFTGITITDGCIFDDASCLAPHYQLRLNVLRSRGAMVNGIVHPDFTDNYARQEVTDGFASVAARQFILSAAAAARSMAAKAALQSTCTIQ